MPAIAMSYVDRHIAQAFAGTPYQVRATPQGRNSVVRDNRPPCCGNNSCIPICPIQAKYDATVHVARSLPQFNVGAVVLRAFCAFSRLIRLSIWRRAP